MSNINANNIQVHVGEKSQVKSCFQACFNSFMILFMILCTRVTLVDLTFGYHLQSVTGNKSVRGGGPQWRRGRLRKKMSCADEMPRRGAGLVQKLQANSLVPKHAQTFEAHECNPLVEASMAGNPIGAFWRLFSPCSECNFSRVMTITGKK